jgi:hypothetical protein
MRGVCEERFEGLIYHQGASIRQERVEASNSYVRTLIFNSFSFIAFLPLFIFFLVFYSFSPFFNLVFLSPFVSPFFFALVLTLFFFGSCGFISTLPQLAWD